jgi:hypothetical protein
MMLCGNLPVTSSDLPYENSLLQKSSSQTTTRAQRQAAARTAAAKSKSKLWGPSHSFDSDDDSTLGASPRQAPNNGGWWETVNKAWVELGNSVQTVSSSATATWSAGHPVKRSRSQLSSFPKQPMEVVPEEHSDEDSTDPSTQEDSQDVNNHNHNSNSNSNTSRFDNSRNTTQTTEGISNVNRSIHESSAASSTPVHDKKKKNTNEAVSNKVEDWTDLFSNACGAASPCSAHDLEELFGRQRRNNSTSKHAETGLGIAPLKLDYDEDEDDILRNRPRNNTLVNGRQLSSQQEPPQRTLSEDSPLERRRQRAAVRHQKYEDAARSVTESRLSDDLSSKRQVQPAHEDFEVTSERRVLVTQPPSPERMVLQYPPLPEAPLPLETLLVKEDEAAALERSISELTMRSSYQGEVTRANGRPAAPDQRRMAYYAVGRHHRLNSGPRSGGNRRCYFTGKLIFGGAPFYAGIVQQGLRTLVVFCLPSALGMPHNLPAYQASGATPKRRPSLTATAGTGASTRSGGLLHRSRRTLSSAASASIAFSRSPSKLSSTINLDDMSLSIEGDIDPNWNLDKDFLLSILPEPSDQVLAEMNQRYPEQFETLPVQVRHASCWRLFVKFCFFSGLPIAEGELHYQVRPSLALEMYGEDIVLSHDVMEAVNGASSAEILKLPNRKTFRYLKKHYPQQSQKLPEIVFDRTSWEQVKPEV